MYTIREISFSRIHSQNLLGEGPLWHPAENRLYWIDIDKGLIQILDPNTNEVTVHRAGRKVGCLAFRKQGGLLLATEQGFAFWDSKSGIQPDFFQAYSPGSPNMMNDGRVDPLGRFWAGSKGPKGTSSLFRVDSDLSAKVMLENVSISNGIDWSPDGKSCYYTDSGDNVIYRYDFDLDEGTLSGRTVFFRPDTGTPDGLTVDSAGDIWTALWDGWKVLRLSPEGEILEEIRMPVSRPTSVALGGADLKTLFITSARVDLTSKELAQQPLAGDLFAISVQTPGRPVNFFA